MSSRNAEPPGTRYASRAIVVAPIVAGSARTDRPQHEPQMIQCQALLRLLGGSGALAAMRVTTPTSTPAYFEKYENLAFSRDDQGVLVLRFHTNGGPVMFTGRTHGDLPLALEELSLDPSNKPLVIAGTGDSFMDEIDGPSLGEILSRPRGRSSARRVRTCCSGISSCRCPWSAWPTDRRRSTPSTCSSATSTSPRTGRRTATRRTRHSGSPAATAYRSCARRWPGRHAPSGCCGPVSASKRRPRSTGGASEVVPHERPVDRASRSRELAAGPALYRSLQKQTLNLNLHRRITQDVRFGMAHEGLTAADMGYEHQM